MATDSPPPGWYAHPTMAGTQRYWDGATWTDHIAPGAPQQSSNADAPSVSEGLLTAGWVTAIFLPLVGFIIGCVVLTRRPGQGVGMMVFAVGSAVLVWSQFL